MDASGIELPDLDWVAGGPGLAPGHDALHLARAAELRPGDRILELGTGQGAVALMLAARAAVRVAGVEREGPVLAVARENERRNAGRLAGRVDWLCADLRALPWRPGAAGFDLVVMNPPYHRAGSGRLPPDPLRAGARHELHGGLAEWVAAAADSLRPGGRLLAILLAARQAEMEALLAGAGFAAVRFQPPGDGGADARWRLVHARLESSRSSATASR